MVHGEGVGRAFLRRPVVVKTVVPLVRGSLTHGTANSTLSLSGRYYLVEERGEAAGRKHDGGREELLQSLHDLVSASGPRPRPTQHEVARQLVRPGLVVAEWGELQLQHLHNTVILLSQSSLVTLRASMVWPLPRLSRYFCSRRRNFISVLLAGSSKWGDSSSSTAIFY